MLLWLSLGALVLQAASLPWVVSRLRKIEPRAERPVGAWPFMAALWMPAVFLFAQAVAFLTFIGDTPLAETSTSLQMAVMTLAFAAAGGYALVVARAMRSDEAYVALGLQHLPTRRTFTFAVLAWLAFLPSIFAVSVLSPELLAWFGHEPTQQDVLLAFETTLGLDLACAALLAVLVQPFLEELCFRGFLQPWLEHHVGLRMGAVLCSILFAALHGADAFLPVFTLSMLLAWVMIHTRSLYAAWTVHALHNGLMLALFLSPLGPYLEPEPDAPRTAMAHFPQENLFHALEGGAFAARNATLTGDITLAEDVGIWFGCVVRGDDAPLSIGRRTNIQDLSMIHADTGVPNRIGEECTVGHRVVLHGAEIADRCLIGMGAVLLGGSRIGAESIIAAGCVVKENFEVPPRSLVVGVPGKIVREVTDEELRMIQRSAEGYVRKIRLYLA